LVLAVTMALLELGLRAIAFLPGRTGSLASDPEVGIVGLPHITAGGVTTNAGGFNDRERPNDARAPRAVFIGDSFTFGVTSFMETFPHRVEVLMGGYEAFPVVNLGVGSTGPQEYLAMTRKRALPMRPHWVIVTIFVGNDILQAHANYRTLVYLADVRLLYDPWRIGTHWDQYYLPRMLDKATRALVPGKATTREGIAACATRPGTAARLSPFVVNVYTHELVVYAQPYTDTTREAFVGLTKLVADMAEAVTAAGARALFVIAPSEIQLDPDLRQTVLRCVGGEGAGHDFQTPQRLLRGFFEARRLAYVDLWPAFSRHSTTHTYVSNDTHWSAFGNDVAAREVAATLRDLGAW
jgi:hypothetical protein